MRKLMKIVGGLLLVVLLLAAAFVALNLFDEELDPEAQKILAPEPVTVAAETNGYFNLVGLDAPLGTSPNVWGQKRIALLSTTFDKDLPGEGEIRFVGKKPACDL